MESKRIARYEILADRLAELIASGAYRRGARLPSIRELARDFGVSVNTARDAYALLERRRYVEAFPQRGYFVADRETVAPVSVPDPTAMNPERFSICSIYGASQKTGDFEEDSSGLAIATLSRRLWPVERLQRHAVDAARIFPVDSFDYQMSPGYPLLREQIAIHGLASGTRLIPENLVVTSGCQEALYLALSAVASPGAAVAIESPVYFNLIDMLGSLGLRILEIPTSEESGMSLAALEFVLDEYRVAAVLTIANFNNPIGSCMSDEGKASLVRLCASRGIPLIEDDVYGDLNFETRGVERPRTCKSFDRDGGVLYCSSFSKTLSPGLRVGWIEAGRWRAQVEKRKTIVNIGASSIAEVTAALYLREGGFSRHLRRLRSALADNVSALRASILEHFPEGTTVTDPRGGMVLWIGLPDGVSSMELYRLALARKIMIAPGRVFSLRDRFESRFRLNAGVWEPGTGEKIRELGALARTLPVMGRREPAQVPPFVENARAPVTDR